MNNRFHPLDKLIKDDSLCFLEAVIPFVDYPLKRLLVIFIKYKELTYILDALSDHRFMSECGFDCHPENTDDMLRDMCGLLPGDIAGSVNQIKSMMQVMQMMNNSSDMRGTCPPFNGPAANPSCSTSDGFAANPSCPTFDGPAANPSHTASSGSDLYSAILDILNNNS